MNRITQAADAPRSINHEELRIERERKLAEAEHEPWHDWPEWQQCILIFVISVAAISFVSFLLMIQGKL